MTTTDDRTPPSGGSVSVGIALVLLATLLTVGGLLLSTQRTVDNLRKIRTEEVRLAQAAADIKFYDEVLTNAAIRFTLDNDPRWEQRYLAAVAQLDEVLALSRQLSDPIALSYIEDVSEANDELIALENDAFALAREGRLLEAQSLLTGPYDEFKAAYSGGLDQFAAAQQQRLETSIRSNERSATLLASIAVTLATILIGALVLLLRLHRRDQRTVTEQRHALAERADIDALTGLPNRRVVGRWFNAALASSNDRGVAALFIDLDGFKQVNDTMGHRAGDEVLEAVAQRMRFVVPRTALLARLGGDEFVVGLAPGSDAEGAAALANRLVDALSLPVKIFGTTVTVTTSIGIAFDDGTMTAQQLLSLADAALYEAKHAGRGRAVEYDPMMTAHLHDTSMLNRDLADSISADSISAGSISAGSISAVRLS
jgi:diguanylate cyclase (GGDEF)-like protein